MKIQVTRRVKTTKDSSKLLEIIEDTLRGKAAKVRNDGSGIVAEGINQTFGSINRSDMTTFSSFKKDDGYMLSADCNYKPSVAFWVLIVIGLVLAAAGGAGFLIIFPVVGFYLYHKKIVREALEDILMNAANIAE